MKQRFRLSISLCCLGGLLLGTTALGQQDPRAVVVRPAAASKAGGARASQASARRAAPTKAKRYWADYAGNAIQRSNTDGTEVETLATNAESPYGVSYDPSTGYVLWTSASDEVVQMAPEGGGETITLNTSFEENFAVVVNGSEFDVVYGVDAGQVLRITQNRNTGEEQRLVLFTLPYPEQVHGLALTPDHSAIYLGDTTGRMTQKLNLSTLEMASLVYEPYEPEPDPDPDPCPIEVYRWREPCTVDTYVTVPYLTTPSGDSAALDPAAARTWSPPLLPPTSQSRSSAEGTR